MKQFFIILSLLNFITTVVLAQDNFDKKPEPGKIKIISDPRVDELVQMHIDFNEENGEIPGYRIQLSASANRAEIYNLKADFYKVLPEYMTYVVYHQPVFKLRVGDFRDRVEAYRHLMLVTEHPEFKTAFIVNDDIKPRLPE